MIEISCDKNLVGPWVFGKVGKTWGPEGREVVGVVDGDEVLGGFVFEDCTGRSVVGHVALSHPHVPIRKLLAAAAIYTYYQLGVEKVLVPVASTNIKSINFVTKLGFQPEALIKDALLDGDMLIFSLTKDQCGFLPPQQEAA